MCRAHWTRATWIFVRGDAVGHTLGERRARDDASWANLRFTSPFDVALHMAAPFLVEAGPGPAVVTRLLLGRPRPEPAYCRPFAERPSASPSARPTAGRWWTTRPTSSPCPTCYGEPVRQYDVRWERLGPGPVAYAGLFAVSEGRASGDLR